MTIMILLLVAGFNILLSQQDCYNLDFVDKSWFRKDSIVSVENIKNQISLTFNNKLIQKVDLNGEIIDLKIYDILGKNIPFEFTNSASELKIIFNEEILKNKHILITISLISRNGIRYQTIKHYLE